jgi:alkylation response protein AidB-like acyl-CoA dehydrogenase
MASYTPPLRDISFVLTGIADLEALSGLPTFKHADPDTVMGALDEAGRFISEVIAPTNVPGDREGSRLGTDATVTTPTGFREAYGRFVEAGWPSLPFPAEWGGHDMPWLVGLALQEMLKSANMAFALCPMLTQSAIEALLSHGSPDQKSLYLHKLVSGEWTGTMLLTESHAGSDLGPIRTRAVPVGDGTYRLFGQKIFITWGEHDLTDNIIHMTLARTPDAPPGTKGISLFIVPKYLVHKDGGLGERNDIKVVSLEHKLGIHASPTCVMALGDGGEGAIGYLVGEENRGLRQMFTMMNNARLAVGVEGLSISERAFQQALAYARERRQGRAVGAAGGESSLIIEHPDVRRMLMTMKANIEAMRALLYTVAEAVDLSNHAADRASARQAEQLVALLTPVAKAWCTDLGIEMTSLGVQIHGGMGYVEDTGAAQHFRDSRISAIYEGTNGIHGIDLVARKLPMEDGAVMAAFLDRMATVDTDLAAAGDLESIRTELAAAIDLLRDATAWCARATDPNDALAAATPYLRMVGTVTGGWLMARAALEAGRRLKAGDGEPAFLEAKLATARFYCEQLLPQVRGLVAAVKRPADVLFAIDPDTLAG